MVIHVVAAVVAETESVESVESVSRVVEEEVAIKSDHKLTTQRKRWAGRNVSRKSLASLRLLQLPKTVRQLVTNQRIPEDEAAATTTGNATMIKMVPQARVKLRTVLLQRKMIREQKSAPPVVINAIITRLELMRKKEKKVVAVVADGDVVDVVVVAVAIKTELMAK